MRFLFVSCLCLPVACDDDPQAPTGDEFAGESASDGEAGKADGGAGMFTFFRVENDFRKCVSPLCGGYWVSRLNRSTTRCADGKLADRCYVAEADLAGLGLGDAQAAEVIGHMRAGVVIVRGDIVEHDYAGFGNLGRIVATEAWIADSESEPDGVFTHVTDSNIVCITTPCPNPLHESKLNSVQHAVIEEVDLSYTDADADAIDAAYAELYGDAGLLMAGYRYYFWDGGWKKGRLATQFYTRVVAQPQTEPTTCVRAGCSSELCVPAAQGDIVTPCVYEPEFACYADASCALQEGGVCGFTSTPELQACLDAN